MLAMPASTEDLDLLAAVNEVKIETQSGDRVHRTVIWVATESERLYVRSVRGDSGRWYQRAVTNPEVALIVGDTRVAFRRSFTPRCGSNRFPRDNDLSTSPTNPRRTV